jgi:hypothetical protein
MSHTQEWSSSAGEFPSNFFDAINQADGDAAVAVVTAVARAADGTLTPRAAELDSIGEWDSKMELSLVCLGGHCCPGKVGQAGSARFCGRPKSECTIPGHKKVKSSVEAGWYISAGAKNAGVFEQPRLPIERDGGPITASGAAFLIDGEASFKQPKGRWLLPIETYLNAMEQSGKTVGLQVTVPSYDDANAVGDLSPDSYEQITFSRAPSVTFATQVPQETTGGSGGGGSGGDGDDDGDDYGGGGGDPGDLSGAGGDGPGGGGDRSSGRGEFFPDDGEPDPDNEQDELIRQVRSAVRQVMQETEQRVRTVAYQSQRASEVMTQRLSVMEDALEETRVELTIECNNLRRTQDVLAAERRAGADLARRIDEVQATVESNTRYHRTNDATADSQTITALGTEVSRCVHALFNNQGVVPLLKTQFTAFRERLESGGGVECHGVKFASKKQLLSWYAAQNLDHPAIFLDALAILHGIRSTYKDPLDALKEVEIQGRVQYKSTLESALKNSFAYPIPPILTGGKKDTEGLGMFDVLKGALKTFQAWRPDDEPSGVAMQIEEGVDNVSARWADYRESITTNSELTVLTAGLITDSKLFLIELVRFVNDQNTELLKGSAYSATQVWAMQLECLATIFKELAAARASAESSGQQHAGYYVWAMLRAWEIQQRYRKNKFKDDPALTGIMVRRIVIQGGDGGFMSKLKQLEDTLKTLEQQCKSQSGELRKLQAAAKGPAPK